MTEEESLNRCKYSIIHKTSDSIQNLMMEKLKKTENVETLIIKSDKEDIDYFDSIFFKIKKLDEVKLNPDDKFIIYSEHDVEDFENNFKISYNYIKVFIQWLNVNKVSFILIINDELTKFTKYKDILLENNIVPIVIVFKIDSL